MSCALCNTCFSTPSLSALSSKTQSNGTHQLVMHPRSSSFDRVSSQAALRTAMKCLRSSLINVRFIMNTKDENHRPSSSRRRCGPISCIHMTISGYWVGPDFEDGWGYVEASVNQVVMLQL
ncbi:uncharacterized protein LOC131231277 [Magnolia sinica]|uniref:uncharacterized protein LOC131231277 n=1 Tax=Magnolia sinica TaxID=86752 RepID=UPI0026587DB0|nr:uncharacterized protein LOC131231277 [Magnolia sinica]